MNLVVLTKQFGNFTGATISTIELLKRVASNFDEVTVLTLKSDGTRIDGVQVQVVDGYVDLIKRLRTQKNAIGYSDDHLGFLFSFCNIKYVHTYHGNWPDARNLNLEMFIKSFYFIPLYKYTIRKANIVVNVSQYMKEKFVDSLNHSNKTIYNGVKKNGGKSPKDDLINEFNNAKRRYLMVGNIDKRKYEKTIKIFDELENNAFQGEIDIYGGLLNKSLVKKIKKYKFVSIEGMVDKVDYAKYDALICTSASENLPVSIVESIINGVPVITSNVGGISEVVINNENGYLIDVNDYRTFADMLLHYKKIVINPKTIRQIKSIFSWDTSAELYMNIFKKIEVSIDENNYSRSNTR